MIWSFLTERLTAAFAAAGYPEASPTVERSKRPDIGQFQCTTAMTLARVARKSPVVIARGVVEHLGAYPFERVSVDGPGFINFALADAFLAGETAGTLDDARQGCPTMDAQKLIIDFGGPNVAKRMHVGHLRSMIIGDSLQRISRFLGHDVVSDVHFGDWGLPMGMLITEIRRRWPALPYFAEPLDPAQLVDDVVTVDLLSELYPEAARRTAADPAALEEAKQETTALQAGEAGRRALWRRMVELSKDAVRADAELLGVTFDLWEGESDVHDELVKLLARLKEQGIARESEGALVIPVERAGDAEPVPPCMLVKGDGSVTYAATDIATIEQRVERFHPDVVWYVVDQRQRLHFVQVFRASEEAGIVVHGKPRLEHVGFGTVNGPDGKPFKTRAGETMSLRALLELTIEEALGRLSDIQLAAEIGDAERDVIANRIGLAAIKFADLRNHRQSDYIFDLAQFSSFEGKTGPYLCYTTIRARSILAKAAERAIAEGELLPPATDEERELSLRLLDFGRALLATFERAAPNVLCEHAFELAQVFNVFYHSCHILSEPDAARRASQLRLTRGVADQLALALSLLGIEPPARM